MKKWIKRYVELDLICNEQPGRRLELKRGSEGEKHFLISNHNCQISIKTVSGLPAKELETRIVSLSCWDSNVIPGIPAVIVHLTCRIQGFYVAKGNPKEITHWKDFGRDDITMVNREQGAGSRVLLDENLRMIGVFGKDIAGYDHEIQSHLTVASIVASGKADVAIGTEKIAKQVEGIDFVPIKKERYDIVFRREDEDRYEIQSLLNIIRSQAFQEEFSQIGGYDTKDMGKVVIEF
ncbi:substrate-binding domain-containing protein [Desulfosarcina ovata]|nr:substrate-binding domain-containing protein [Desulfosarcina ovata]